MTISVVPTPAPHPPAAPTSDPARTIACADVALIAQVINTVWKDCTMPEPGIDAAFEDLIAGFAGLLPDCWHRRRFNLACTRGIEL